MKYLHTMVRISNVDRSLDFYCNKLGFREVRRMESAQGRSRCSTSLLQVTMTRTLSLS